MVNKLIINYKTLNAPDSVGWISKRKVFIYDALGLVGNIL